MVDLLGSLNVTMLPSRMRASHGRTSSRTIARSRLGRSTGRSLRQATALRRASPEPAEAVINADGLEIDLAVRAVRRDGSEVHLTPIEFELLRLLARNRGRLMTHRAILTEVWGAGYADDTQVLRAHVANLRRKIEPAEGPRYIKTDPGVGYRFAG